MSIAELALSPALPSTTARAGGIFVPIIKFLAKSVGGDVESGNRLRMGAFLMQAQLQQSSYSSALFLTSGAQNLLCLQLAAELGACKPQGGLLFFCFTCVCYVDRTHTWHLIICTNAAHTGAVVPDAWTTWFVGCLPPALLGMIITPILLFKLFPPQVSLLCSLQLDGLHCYITMHH